MQALSAQGQVNRVWVVGQGDTAELREVQVGQYQDNWVRILSGLKKQDRVVVSGSAEAASRRQVADFGLRTDP